MSDLLKGLFFLSCFFRITSQRFWETFNSPFIFYLGLAFFELIALISVRQYMGNKKMFIDFFIVTVLFDLVKYLWLQPYEISYNEDLGFIIGVGLIIFEYVYRNYIKRR